MTESPRQGSRQDGAAVANPRALPLLGIVAGWAVLMGLLEIAPAVGAALCVVACVVVVPLGGDRASTRLVSIIVLALGALALALALGDTLSFRVLSLSSLQLGLAAVGTAAAAFAVICTVGRRPVPWARPDATLLPLLLVTAVAWFSGVYPTHGVDLGQAIGGLMSMGWDHQPHFSIFTYLYDQEGAWRQGAPESASMFLGYPPLAGAIAAVLTTLTSPAGLEETQLVRPYIHAASGMFGLSVGLLAWTAAEAGRAVATAVTSPTQRARVEVVAVMSGLAVGGYVLLGPASALFDHGFSNFALAVAIATSASWLVLVESDRAAARAALVAVAAATAMGLLWTPLVVLLLPAGLVLVVRVVRRRAWTTLVLVSAIAGLGMWVVLWQVQRMIPDGPTAKSYGQALASLGGGQPAVPLPHLAILLALGLTVLAVTRNHSGIAWRAPWAVTGAGVVITLGFVANSLRLGFPVVDAYYVAKSAWGVYLSMLPLIGAFVAAAMLMVVQAQEGRTRLGLVGALTMALVWLSTPTQKYGHFDYYALPVGAQAVLDRQHDFRGGPEGDMVLRAHALARRQPGSMPIIWNGRDLLTNRWLASLVGELTLRHDMVYRALDAAPDGRAGLDVLAQALEADGELDVAIVTSKTTSEGALRSLGQQFPGRVTLHDV